MARIALPGTAFALDPSRKAQGGRLEDVGHLRFIRTLPCLVSGLSRGVEAAHIRYGAPDHGKPGTPMGRKPDDRYVVPLTGREHRTGPNAQHGTNERAWWQAKGIDPVLVALALYDQSGDYGACVEIIRQARLGAGANVWGNGL